MLYEKLLQNIWMKEVLNLKNFKRLFHFSCRFQIHYQNCLINVFRLVFCEKFCIEIGDFCIEIGEKVNFCERECGVGRKFFGENCRENTNINVATYELTRNDRPGCNGGRPRTSVR